MMWPFKRKQDPKAWLEEQAARYVAEERAREAHVDYQTRMQEAKARNEEVRRNRILTMNNQKSAARRAITARHAACRLRDLYQGRQGRKKVME